MLSSLSRKPLVPVVHMTGQIADKGPISFSRFSGPLKKAFAKADKERCVAIVIDSPGGSPSQSELIGNHIRELSDRHEIPVFAFVEGTAASGGYWISCAADEIYTLNSSIVGSIGVIGGLPNFHKFLQQHGIDYIQLQAGKNKAPVGMFTEVKPEDVKNVEKEVLHPLHDVFKDWVKERRGDRLPTEKTKLDELFSARVWVGRNAVDEKTGLVDGVSTMDEFLKEKYGSGNFRTKDFTPKAPKIRRIPFLSFGGSEETREERLVRAAVAEVAEKLGIPEHPFDFK